MTSTQRLLAVLRGDTPDRVPISTYELVGHNPLAWENNDPTYAQLMAFIRAKTDCLYMTDLDVPNLWDRSHIDVKKWDAESQHHQLLSMSLPSGTVLTRHSMHTDDVHTTWTLKHWCSTLEEAEEMIHRPHELGPVDFTPLEGAWRDLDGRHGIPMLNLGDALIEVCELFEFGEFTILAMTETDRVVAVLDTVHQRRLAQLDRLLDHPQVPGTLWRIVGPEYACPPYLPPAIFSRLVTPYVKMYAHRLRSAGAFSRVHIHGKIARALDDVVAMGVDAIDPVEPPPDGDIEIGDIKSRCPNLCIMGGIEIKHLEAAGEALVEQLVRDLMAQGKPGGRFVLMPTAAPINTPLSAKTQQNYIRFIQTALDAGAY